MSEETVFTLLQFVALALPAIGIYLQVLRSLHRPDPNSSVGVDTTRDMLDFNLAKAGLLIIAISGLLDVLYLLILRPPLLFPNLGGILLVVLIYASLFLIGFGLFLFCGSVFFSFGMPMSAGQNPTLRDAIILYIRLLIRGINPRDSIGPDR